MRLNKSENLSAGFTLIELMIAMAIAGVITAAMFGAFQAQVRGQVSQDNSMQMTQSQRFAMEIISSDIRMAGCDPMNICMGSGCPGAVSPPEIVTADDDELRLRMDITGGPLGQPDGDTNDVNEDVRYAINGNGDLGREIGGAGGLLPIHSTNMACEVLDFVYLDSDENVLGTPVADTEDIRSIQVSIILRSVDTANPGFLSVYTDNTSYRNLQGTEILAPPGDEFRRFQLSSTILCRNL